MTMLSAEEIAAHNSRYSCWVVIRGQAYDVTDFIDEHPGGSNSILKHAGMDATKDYEAIHPPGTIQSALPKEKQLGPVTGWIQSPQPAISEALACSKDTSTMPLEVCQSLEDIEKVGLRMLSPRARVYFESSAESLTSHRRNREDWAALNFRPRVLRNVTYTSMQCHIMGSLSSMPIFIAPAAAAKLGHEEGEICLTRGAARMAIPQCVCTYSSVSHAEIVKCFQEDPEKRGGALFFQLYVPKVKGDAEKLISKAKTLGFDALIVTVDSPVIGKRTDDDRLKAAESHAAGRKANPSQLRLLATNAESPRAVHCSNLEWSDLALVRQCWGKKPIILKGIQTAEDALKATEYDVDAIYLSNHGGRQLDFAPSPVQTLLEIWKQCPQVFKEVEVYVDGGVMRGSDVVKALCLGARAVGLGRGFMYALSAYGTEGVLRAIEILGDEIQTTMKLLGVNQLAELNDSYIETGRLDYRITRDKVISRI